MFDRIGRIDDETPFVVEWFAKHGIEVWSTQEGQQRFDNHVDKLTNYLRFWQASGESEKTSIRIRNKMQQMALSGLYTGGPVRFGYHLVNSGLVNRKGAPIRKYEIDPGEREVLQLIDDMTIHKGYGSYRMADFLNKEGDKTNNGSKFTSIKILRILKDPCYCGKMEDGTTSEQLQALRIRSDETYEQILRCMREIGRMCFFIGITIRPVPLKSPFRSGRKSTSKKSSDYLLEDSTMYAVEDAGSRLHGNHKIWKQ